ncbi:MULTISPECIES: guanylate kinase [Rhodomicrobium]|uniref:guanylate kinase n=1 Tax=Rhodomicrobium TaxID=1068 RepID=UPI000B4AD84B|nr:MULTISPECIES: guanylate kinase [Rhodomicrobium]
MSNEPSPGRAGGGAGRRGLMLILSSPSGAGKTTLTRRLLAEEGAACLLSVSATTRPPRPGERDGEDYVFLARAEFETRRDSGHFIEWAEVFGNLYGTQKEPVEAALAGGRDVVFDIDWQGARQLSASAPGDVARVFILPPSRRVLAERLKSRAGDPPEVIAHRLASASSEIVHWDEYDYVIVNEDLSDSLAALRAILAAERLKRTRQPGLGDFVAGLLREG